MSPQPNRAAVIGAIRGLLSVLGLRPADLADPVAGQATPPAAIVAAPRQRVAPLAPAPKPAKKAAPAKRAPPDRPAISHAAQPPKRVSAKAEVVVPPGVRVQALPSRRDTRYVADEGADGAGFMADWRRKRGKGHA